MSPTEMGWPCLSLICGLLMVVVVGSFAVVVDFDDVTIDVFVKQFIEKLYNVLRPLRCRAIRGNLLICQKGRKIRLLTEVYFRTS